MSRTPEAALVKYPRRTLSRGLFRLIARALLPVLAQVDVRGRENFPQRGPLIVVGNHTAALEVVLMTVYSPRIVEYMGSTDIPHEKMIGLFVGAYGFIPVFRGNVSRSSMQAGLDVLRQGGVLGIFPEGGIWEPSIRQAQTGVAWLSYHAQAPVLPIGFGSMRGSLNQLMRLRRPPLSMNVGTPLPPVGEPEGVPRKQHFQQAADRIMDAVWELIPEQDRQQGPGFSDERFELVVLALDHAGRAVAVPSGLVPSHGSDFAKFTHRTTLINNLRLNLRLPVEALMRLADRPPLDEIRQATGAILDHLRKDNPYYFTYRYGQRQGSAMADGVGEVHALAGWAAEHGYSLQLTPLRTFLDLSSGERRTLDRPEVFRKW
jgi:1-acyl-sn-glycerol-3-phosphate acyltransferase